MRAAQTFFESPAGGSFSFACADLALAFAALALLQSAAICPAPPQNMQRLLVNRRCRSSEVSFPSLPSLSAKGFDEEVDPDAPEPEVDDDLPDLLSFLFLLLLLLLLLLLPEEPELPDEEDLPLSSDLPLSDLSGLSSDLPLPPRDFSRCRSQCRASMECARVFISSSVLGFPCWLMMSLIRSASPE